MSAQRNGKWYAVTAVGIPLDKATLVFEEGSDGLLRPLKTLERKELAQGLRQRAGLMPTPVEAEEQAFAKCFFAACKHGEPVEARSARAVEAVRMLVRVADGRVVAREAVNIPAEAQAFARVPHPGTATGCWEAVRAVEAERNRLALEMVAAEWPRCLRERRLVLRDARIRVLLDGAAAAGDVSARVRLGREAYERHDDAEAVRRLAGLEDRDAMARAVLAVMGLEGRLPKGVLAPEVRAGDPWPLAVPSRQAFGLCLAAVKRAGASPQGAEDAWKAHVDCGVVERLQGAARAGYPFAQWWLARLYKEGVGVARSPERAGTWLAAAAAAGRPEALGELAALRQDAGDAALPPWCGVQTHNPLWDGLRGEDPDLDFFALAAKRHNPAALVVVARRTARHDPARAKALFQEALARGRTEVRQDLAELAESGQDVAMALRMREAEAKAHPGDCCAVYRYGAALQAVGRLADAEAAYRRCLDLCGNFVGYQYGFMRHKAQEALKALGCHDAPKKTPGA